MPLLARRYAFQSPCIARRAQATARAQVPTGVMLPVAARRRIQRVLDKHGGQ